jgi:hypothetical protein
MIIRRNAYGNGWDGCNKAMEEMGRLLSEILIFCAVRTRGAGRVMSVRVIDVDHY